MITHAIVEASGKQLIVQEGGFYDISNLPLKEKETFFFNRILFVCSRDTVSVGAPYLAKEYKINATVLQHCLDKKTVVYKMRPKKKFSKTFTHKNYTTRIVINFISKK